MNILLFGASGCAGYAAVGALRQAGRHATGLLRDPAAGRARQLPAQGVEVLAGDLRQLATYRAALAACDVCPTAAPDSQDAAMKAARRRELRAEADLRRGHEWSARENSFTAQVLYGGARWAIEANTPLNRDLNEKKTNCYAQFMRLAGRPIEQLDVPLRDRAVLAIFSLPPAYRPGERLPCVVTTSGTDGWKELPVAVDGDKFLLRGFAVLASDGPGQGEALSREIWFDPAAYGQLGPAAYAFAAARPEVDPARIVVHGLGFGSHWSAALLAHEPRFLAGGAAMTCFEPDGFSLFETASPPFQLRLMYLTNTPDEAALDQLRAPLQPARQLAPRISCPFLVAAGEDDQLTDLGDTFAFVNQLAGPEYLVVYEGEAHDIPGSRAGRLGPPSRWWPTGSPTACAGWPPPRPTPRWTPRARPTPSPGARARAPTPTARPKTPANWSSAESAAPGPTLPPRTSRVERQPNPGGRSAPAGIRT